MKTCKVCKIEKPFDCFGVYVRSSINYRNTCKDCNNSKRRAINAANRKPKLSKDLILDIYDSSPHESLTKVWRGIKHYPFVSLLKNNYIFDC